MLGKDAGARHPHHSLFSECCIYCTWSPEMQDMRLAVGILLPVS